MSNHLLFFNMAGFKIDIGIENNRDNFINLDRDVSEYIRNGQASLVKECGHIAQVSTRQYIEDQFPDEAFHDRKTGEGKSLKVDNYNGHTHKQIIKGSFGYMSGNRILRANIYANYFARWFTGGTRYRRGEFIFLQHKADIESHYAKKLEEVLAEKFDLKYGKR